MENLKEDVPDLKGKADALRSEILRLKEENGAIILAHNYQRPEIQDIADYIGDSLGLSRKAVETDAEVILFCGVDFMAETAAILNPDKKVLLPDLSCRCPMAMMLSADELRAVKAGNPGAKTVLYINTSAESKAEADCICTSANADAIVNSMDSDTVIFGPDKNLAYYVRKRSDKKIITVPEYGVCPTHHQISLDDVLAAKEKHPGAEVIAHPEVVPEVQDTADHIASTEGMLTYCRDSPAREFIIVTEEGLVHRLSREVPGKTFHPVSGIAVCPPMKMLTLEKVRDALKYGRHEIKVDPEIAAKARRAIERMLALSGSP